MQLELNNPQIFTKSFERENLAYMVFEVEDKGYLMEQILRKNPQSSIVYVSNRRACSDTVSQLEIMGFSATYYHGGLSPKDKENHMQLWMNEKVQVSTHRISFNLKCNF